ncbi:MAG: imidazole glycerol phosphate synthase subunit HisH [Clostridia bacterium]|nr:imidazole glycerol phosphate synthase subunit HisH [Clostridia bacterium]
MVAIIDYGVGNLFSLLCSFSAIGEKAVATADPEIIKKADRIILPGVGAFSDAARKLRESGTYELIIDEAKNGKPLLGICLGMQLLFEKSYEYGEHQGLGLIKGAVKPISGFIPKGYKIPHIGWNGLIFKKETPVFKYINNGDHVYFVHSYHACECDDATTAVTEYGGYLTASVQSGNVFGTQFHPEKSGDTGLKILKAFTEI